MKKLSLIKHTAAVIAIAMLALSPKPAATVSAAAGDAGSTAPVFDSIWIDIDESNIAGRVTADAFVPVSGNGRLLEDGSYRLDKDSSINVAVNAPAGGSYYLAYEFRQDKHLIAGSSITLKAGSQEVRSAVNSLWTDAAGGYPVDRFNNEFLPEQTAVDDYHTDYITYADKIDANPVKFELNAGENLITITSNTQPVFIRQLILVQAHEPQDYAAYRQDIRDKNPAKDLITVEAEKYSAKSHSFISPSNIQNPGLHPYDLYNKKINVIGNLNEGSGYKLLWEFKVEHSGNYKLAFLYNQKLKKDIPSFADIEIDGKPLFSEMNSYPFPYSGSKFRNLVFADKEGSPYEIWLEAGQHTLALRYNGAEMQDAISELKSIMEEINDTGVEIKKISGVSNDQNRVWDIEQYIPGIMDRFSGWLDRLQAVYDGLGYQKKNPAGAVNIKLAMDMLEKLLSRPDKIPSRLSELNEGSGSAAQFIGDLIPELSNQVFVIDRIYLYGDTSLPEAGVSFWTRLLNGIKAFLYSFTENSKGNSTITGSSDEELEFWVSGSIAYVETLQRLTDAQFTPKSGIKVRFSLSADDNKLLLASAAGTAPDGALGIGQHLPYQFAMRGALEDFTQFSDFAALMKEQYNIETLTPYVFEEKVYGAPERQDFYVLMYRKDILNKLNLAVPETWDDVQNIMPALRRQGMSFYIPLSSASGLKPFYATLPFIFQAGGEQYSEDGMRTAIDSEAAIKGFKTMTDLYNIYAFDKQTVNFYNSFRYGTIPIGVGSYNDYLMLKTSAPEIADLWDIALAPGTRQADGSISRQYLAASTADIIMKGADAERSWEFIKWWLSEETQSRYAATMQTQYGPEFMWNTANLNAFRQLSLEEAHIDTVLEQWESIKENTPHPATYMLERELSNAWIDTVMNGKPYRVAIDEAIVNVNREILRKLEEFGYVENGRKIRDYKITKIQDILE